MSTEIDTESNAAIAHSLIDECLTIIDDPRNIDPAALATSIERVHTRRWIAAALDPETWAEPMKGTTHER
ncbi:MAG: hypothetical protein ACYCZN_16180 [Candidatus Dormibacteria bacterium]